MSESEKATLSLLEDIDRISKSLASIDTTDIREASKELADFGELFDTIPVESGHLKQCAPVIALYKTKTTLVKSAVQKAFMELLDYSEPGSIQVKRCMYDTPSLWMAAGKLRLEKVVLSDIALKLTRHILEELEKHPGVSFASGDTRWAFAPKEGSADLPSICEAIVSVFNFMKNTVFVALGGDRVFSEFGRRVWPSLSAALLKKYSPCQALCDLEAAVTQIKLIPSDMPTKLAHEYAKTLTNDKLRDKSKILADIRARLLADVNRKIRKIDKTKGPLAQFKFIPNMVSVEVGRLPAEYFRDPETRDLIPGIISLFCLLRQTQYVDPKGLNARMMGIFFNDTVFLSVALGMLKRIEDQENKGTKNTNPFQAEVAQLKQAGQKSSSAFLNSVVLRAIERLVTFRDRSWNLGLVTKEQYQQADKDINDSLTQVVACVNEWRNIQMDPEIIGVWTTMMIDRITREMNKIAVFTAKAAKGARNSGLWQIYAKFLNSVEKILPPQITDNMTSVKVGRKIRIALTASANDINELKDPFAADENLFGINRIGFETLLQVNPLLNDESRESMARMSHKFMISEEAATA